jgi:peptidoglycan/xylan/chitin deacetylase (PgdA/CDA1 family)
MKRLVRQIVADTLHAGGVHALLRRVRARSLTILCYHRVLPAAVRAESPFPELAVRPEVFARHVEFCARHYRCLPLHEAVEHLRADPKPPCPLLTITFDDGYADNFAYARPILNAQGVQATLFAISALVGAGAAAWYDRLGRALAHLRRNPPPADRRAVSADDPLHPFLGSARNGDRPAIPQLVNRAKTLGPAQRAALVERLAQLAAESGWVPDERDRLMTQPELAQWAADGHEVGSHTATHPILTQLSGEALDDELVQSRTALERMLDRPVLSVAYPNGDSNAAVIDATRRAGYRYGVTTVPGLNGPKADPFRLRRFFLCEERVGRADGAFSANSLELELAGTADLLFPRRPRWRSAARQA